MDIPFSGSSASGFNSSGVGKKPRRERKPRKAVGSPIARVLINLGVTLAVGLVYFYVNLPAINLHAEEFYGFIFLLCLVYCVCALLTSGFQGDGAKGYFNFVKKQCRIPFFLVIGLLIVALVGSATSWVLLRADSYQKLLSVQPGDFVSEVDEISYDQIPMLDRESAMKLGDRKLGELSDMVSQFEVAED